jgi:hypothetical protein
LKYFNDVIITDIERITSIASDPNYDPLPIKNENYFNGDPGTILESKPEQKNNGVKNFGTGFGLIFGPSGIPKSVCIDDSEETVQGSVEMEENWKERYYVIKEKERKIMRAIEREKERATERAEEEEREKEKEIGIRKEKKKESDKVKETNKERIRIREKEKVKNVEIDIENDEDKKRVEERKKRMMMEVKTGRIVGSDIESFAEEQRGELINRQSRLHDENGNRIIMQKWDKEMGEERERKKEKEREEERKWDREKDEEEERESDREKKEGEKKKDEGRKEKKMKGIKDAGEEETITETERVSGSERVRDSPYSLPSTSRVISITPSSCTNSSSSSSSLSPLPHTTSTPTSSSPSPSPSTPSSSSSMSNSASLLHPPSSTIPPLIPPQQTAKETPPPYFDETEQEKIFRQNFNDIFLKIIYETLENVKKEKNSQNN